MMAPLLLLGQFALVFLVFLAALKYPPVVLFIYLLFSSSDSYGIYCAITPGYFGVILDTLLLVAGASAFYGLWVKRNSTRSLRRMFKIAALMAVATLWIGLSVYANGGSMRQIVIAMSIKGPYPVIIAMVYWNDERARKFFLAVVSIQLFLALGTILYPYSPLSIIEASRYNDYAIGSTILELTFERVSGQFLSSLQLAFYAGVGILVSIYLWLKPTTFIRQGFSLSMAVVALLVNYQTMARGVWLSVIASMLVLILKYHRQLSRQVILICGIIAIISAIPLLTGFIDVRGNLDYFNLRFSQFGSSPYRSIALANFPNYFIANPLFGIGDVADKFIFMPHVLPLDFAILYGFVPAILISIFMYRIIKSFYFGMFKSKDNINSMGFEGFNKKDNLFAMMLCVLCLLVSVTNSIAGRVLQYVCLGFSCLPWIMHETQNISQEARASTCRPRPLPLSTDNSE